VQAYHEWNERAREKINVWGLQRIKKKGRGIPRPFFLNWFMQTCLRRLDPMTYNAGDCGTSYPCYYIF